MTFKCKESCGECCGIIPIPKELAKKTEHLAQVKPTKIMQDDQDNLYILTDDMKCVYLNRKTKKCMIYKDRPRTCRLYGLISTCPCPYFKINGKRRNLTERKIIRVQIEATVDRAICRVMQLVQ